jgi:6-pyruvoyltetrahydropterin/6-carboxytetrahydropterin synthase
MVAIDVSERETSAPDRRSATLQLARCDIGFSAAHFSVVDGRAERLHGHNYLVSLQVRGALREDGTVLDFSVLKQLLRAACAELDERMLVPVAAADVDVVEDGHEVVVRFQSRRYVFPAADVRLLPIVNTTCECLAAHLLDVLRAGLGRTPIQLEIRVEETPGQGASAAE